MNKQNKTVVKIHNKSLIYLLHVGDEKLKLLSL